MVFTSEMARSNNGDETTTPEIRRRGLTREQVIAVGSIFMTELCERLTFYSIVANLVLFCTSALNYSSDDAYVVALVFKGAAHLFPVLGGFVSDVWFGKFRTIVGSCMIYIYGFILLLGAAWDPKKLDWDGEDDQISVICRKMYLFSGLLFIAVGIGGFKANIGPYGAQQVADLGSDAIKSFFNWYYWFTNAGAVIAFSGVAYVQQEKGFGYGFLIPFLSIILALIVFVAAKSKYVYKRTAERGRFLHSSIGICMQSCSRCRRPTLNRSRRNNGGGFGNETVLGIETFMRALPLFGLLIVCGTVFSQMGTALYLQTERMDIFIGDAKLPAAIPNIQSGLVVLILIPILDRGLYPILAKTGRSMSLLQRIGIGTSLVACAMLYAGMIEIVRKNDIVKNGYIEQTLSNNKFNASKIGVFAQVPGFVLKGFSGCLVDVTGLEFAYTRAPWFMQGLSMGLFLMVPGLGHYIALLMVAIVKLWRKDDASDWFPKEPNNGHMEYFLFLLAAFAIISLIVFLMIARWYENKKAEVSGDEEHEPEVVSVVEYDNRACEREARIEGTESTAL